MTAEFELLRGVRTVVADPASRPETIEADALVLFLTEGGAGTGACADIDRATGGLVARLVAAGEITGRRYECVPLLGPPGLHVAQLLLVGLGKREELDAGTLYRAAATATRHLSGKARARVALVADGTWSTRQIEQAVAGGVVGMVGQDLYRGDKKRTRFGTTVWVGAPPEAVDRGILLGDGVNLARRLVNTAPDDMYPQTFAGRPRRSPAAPAWRSTFGTKINWPGNAATRSSRSGGAATARPVSSSSGTAVRAGPTTRRTWHSWARA